MATLKVSHDFARNFYEKSSWNEQKLVVGVDEVGRGCLAGPVVSAAVVLKKRKIPKIITDSKLLSPEQRNSAYEWIMRNSYWGIGITHHRHIDQENIYQSTLRSMRRAYEQLLMVLPEAPGTVLVDAMPLILPYEVPVYAFCYGETRSVSIAAASIVAKVTRDNLMHSYEVSFPCHGLGAHKGYSTPLHMLKIKEHGAALIHRTTFIAAQTSQEKSEQQSLFGDL